MIEIGIRLKQFDNSKSTNDKFCQIIITITCVYYIHSTSTSTDVLWSLSLLVTHAVQAACKHSRSFGSSPRTNTLLQKTHLDKKTRISLSWLSVVHSIRWSPHSSSIQIVSCAWDCCCESCFEVPFCSIGSSFTITGNEVNADIPAIDSLLRLSMMMKFDDAASIASQEWFTLLFAVESFSQTT